MGSGARGWDWGCCIRLGLLVKETWKDSLQFNRFTMALRRGISAIWHFRRDTSDEFCDCALIFHCVLHLTANCHSLGQLAHSLDRRPHRV